MPMSLNKVARSIVAVFSLAGMMITGGLMAPIGAQSSPRKSLVVTPVKGPAPLTVEISGTGSGEMEGVMILSYGDGQSDRTVSPVGTFRRSHTFVKAGTYEIELKAGAWGGQKPTQMNSVARAKVIVTSGR